MLLGNRWSPGSVLLSALLYMLWLTLRPSSPTSFPHTAHGGLLYKNKGIRDGDNNNNKSIASPRSEMQSGDIYFLKWSNPERNASGNAGTDVTRHIVQDN